MPAEGYRSERKNWQGKIIRFRERLKAMNDILFFPHGEIFAARDEEKSSFHFTRVLPRKHYLRAHCSRVHITHPYRIPLPFVRMAIHKF